MKKFFRTAAAVLACIGIVFGMTMLARERQNGAAARNAYETAKQEAEIPADLTLQENLPDPVPLAGSPEEDKTEKVLPEPVQKLLQVDLDNLKETNPDVLGWISIPQSPVDYPVLQGEDNEYYLKRTWDDRPNSYGSICLEHRSSPSFTDFNTVIYGHNMNNDQMFGSLIRYKAQDYYEANPVIYVALERGVLRYEIFSAYEAALTEETYRIVFKNQGEKEEFLRICSQKSVIKTEIAPTVEDEILTLSTCTGVTRDTRWVVQAVLTGEFPR